MAWLSSLSFRDPVAGLTTRTFTLVAADYAAAAIIRDALLAAAQGLTSLAIVKQTLTEVDNLIDVADANSNIDRGMTTQFNTGGPKVASINFPSPLVSVVNADRTIDQSDALVLALMVLYTDGDITVSDGELVQFVIGAVLDK